MSFRPTLNRAKDKWTDDEIDRMRRYLAKKWRQSVSQVTDAEARYYLEMEDREADSRD